ncbi:MAG: alpha/beta hydrolase [Flavobacteriales bacterium]|nr:MAG: alpha/beta hydrolase [Flavobacteriales bacterium]
MNVLKRNNVLIKGNGASPMMFAHGFGCDQNMWRFITPSFEQDYQIILFDHVGAGKSDLDAYEPTKYKELDGYASDIIEIAKELGLSDIVFVGHSVSAIMGILAADLAPNLFKALILVAPSPSYINDGDYTGGFSRNEIDELLQSLEINHMGWSMTMAPLIMANADKAELSEELVNSFCRTDPNIAKEFARATFLTDSRNELKYCITPALIIQCSNDIIAPIAVGKFMNKQMKRSKLAILEATGHCPHMSAPEETVSAIKHFLS